MDENNVVARLRSLADTPIDPPQTFSEDLWRRIDAELDPQVSSILLAESTSDEEIFDVSIVPVSVERSLRNPVWVAAAAFAVVFGVGVFLWWLLPTSTSDLADTGPASEVFIAPGPVELAAGDVLWPARDMTGTPSSVAEAFAVEVLGWKQPVATETERGTCLTFPSQNTRVCPTNAATVTLAQNGVDPLQVVLNTIGGTETGQLWAVTQVGPGYTTDRLESADPGTRIPIPTIDEAVQADITMKIANAEDLVEATAEMADLEAGYVETDLVPDPEEVLSVLIRYFDGDGHVITAVGGPWNEFYEWPEPEPAGPEVTIAEGTYQGSEVAWRMSAFHTTEGDLCIRLRGMGCIGDIPSDEHLGAFLTTAEFEAGEEARWCAYGTVRNADTVRLRLPDGSLTTVPIYTNPNFDVDFYAYCSLGDQAASEATALDATGNIIDVVPETNNG